MWLLNQEGPAFRALSYGDRLRLSRCLARGEAPLNPRMAAAAVEVGESYERGGSANSALIRWMPVFLIVCNGFLLITAVIDGDQVKLVLSALIVLVSTVDLALNPMARPKNLARSVEAARWVVPQERPRAASPALASEYDSPAHGSSLHG